jgi:hypothetical protein
MTKEEIQKQIKLMTEYAQMMLDRGDWHGVADAAMDIRELLATQRVIEKHASLYGKETNSCGDWDCSSCGTHGVFRKCIKCGKSCDAVEEK